MNDHACILIWDAHTRMGHNIVPYAYGISHMRMGHPIHVWANIRIWGRTAVPTETRRRLRITDIKFYLIRVKCKGRLWLSSINRKDFDSTR